MTTQTVQTLQFKPFKQQFQAHFANVVKDQTHVFQVNVDKNTLWDTYLNSFPEEHRQHHNCNCCRQFIKNYGNLVAIKDNIIISIWRFNAGNPIFQQVVDNLADLVEAAIIRDVFVTKHHKLGTDYNYDGPNTRWEHFFYELPKSLLHRGSETEATIMNDYRTQYQVFKRSLTEITVDAVETALELAEPKHSVYRLAEFVPIIKLFQKCQQEYANLSDNQKDNYCWITSVKQGAAVSKIRNTAVGTLLLDLSNDEVELDEAVRKFSKVMDPYNYNRKQNITFTSQKQLENSLKRIVELGYEESLGRRFATANDLTIENILWKAGNVKTKSETSLASSLFNELKEDVVVNPKQFSKLESVTITDFIKNIVPKANSIELLLENKHEGNLVSLIAPENMDSPSMFKWDNGFSWSYNKGLADSMKDRVKAAGGKVDGVLRFSIEWNHKGDDKYTDFDAWAKEGNINIGYSTYKKPSIASTTGQLDIDIRNPGNKIAVENIVWTNLNKMTEGKKTFWVNNFSSHTSKGGFKAEIEYDGEIYSFEYNKPLKGHENIVVAEIEFSKTTGIKFIKSLDSTSTVNSKQLWNVNTNKFHKVNMLMYSPNYWDNQQGIGNQHYLFMLENCKADEARGFFNEFLKQDLLSERKVFEALANKMKVAPSDDQLSGVGFSSTQKAEFIVKVTGNFSRMLKVVV